MNRFKLCACVTVACSAMAMANTGLVSAYRFNETLNPSYDRDGRAQALEFRAGGATNVLAPNAPTFMSDTVGAVTKPVVSFNDTPGQEEFFRAFHGMAANGNTPGNAFAEYVNQYTILMDIKITSAGDWVSFFNTTAANANDGDFFIRASDSALGISGQYAGLFPRGQWVRTAIVVDHAEFTSPRTIRIYLDGVLTQTVNVGSYEGRWAMYAFHDAFAQHVDILADNSGDSGAGQLSLLGFYDRALTEAEVQALGPVGTDLVGTLPARLQGTVALAGFTGELRNRIVRVEMRQAGEPNAVLIAPAYLGAAGQLLVNLPDSFAAGSYDLLVRSAGTLQSKLSNVAISATGATLDLSLRIGDVNADDIVDGNDVNATLAAFGAEIGSPEYVEAADVNGDGIVDGNDVNAILANFGAESEF